MWVVTREGRDRFLEFSTTLGRDGTGEPIGRGVSRDVTERRHAEREIRALNEDLEQRVQERTEALRRSQQRFEALARIAPVGIFRTNAWGYATYVNDRWCQITGLTPAVGMGVGYLAAVHPDDRDRFLRPWPTAGASPPSFRFEGRFQRPDGAIVWVMVQLTAEVNDTGMIVGSVGTLTDISDLRRLEEEQRKLASLVENSPDFIGVADLEGRLTYLNAAGWRLVGLDSGDDAKARRITDLVPADTRTLIEQTILPVARERGAWEGELQLRPFDTGEAIHVGSRWFLIQGDDSAQPRALAIVASNISPRKRAEAALRESEDLLRQAQKMEAVGQLAGGIAHDFNNLLTVILGHAQMLDSALPPGDENQPKIGIIMDAAERAATLTRQLLTFSRRQVLRPVTMDLNEAVGGITKLLRRVIGETVELRAVQAPGLGKINADSSQIEQLLMNLVINARDAMPHGGRVTLETRDVELDAAALRRHPGAVPGRYVMLEVSDTGIGMSPEIQARIFEPFFTTKGPGKGTGLGLATVYGIVKQHGAYIAVESAPGQGTTFRIYLPRVEDVEPARDGRSRPAPARGGETILLVEDEADVRAVVRQVLEVLGYAVLEAREGREALDLLDGRQYRIDLLLTDVVMPVMSGWELAEHLRSKRPDLPVVFMSGYTGDAIGDNAFQDTGLALLEKPFSTFALSEAVRAALDSARRGGAPARP